MGWLEHGVFAALAAGYLEKAVLVMSSDDAAEHVLEAWSLSVQWFTDEHGRELPALAMGTGGAQRKTVLPAKARYSQGDLRRAVQAGSGHDPDLAILTVHDHHRLAQQIH